MIPKLIHYCWFGRGKMPDMATRCIASWKQYLPDYELQLWNEDNFDVNRIPYVIFKPKIPSALYRFSQLFTARAAPAHVAHANN